MYYNYDSIISRHSTLKRHGMELIPFHSHMEKKNSMETCLHMNLDYYCTQPKGPADI